MTEEEASIILFLYHNDLLDEDSLAHYGVKGMKWGVIKEQQALIREAERVQNGTKKAPAIVETAKLLKAYGNKEYHESGDMHRLALKAKAYLEGKEFGFKMDPKLAADMDVDGLMNNVVKQINPEFPAKGSQMNCRRCTLTYEMRRRGMDVKATKTTNASGQHIVGLENATRPGQDKATRGKEFRKDIMDRYKRGDTNFWGEKNINDPAFDHVKARQKLKDDAIKNNEKTNWFKQNVQLSDQRNEARAANIRKQLLKQGDGARGELGIAWMLGGGHSVAYEVVKGNPVVFDTQTGKKYTNPKELSDLIGMAGQVAYTRLDNKPLNTDYLMRWAQDA